MDFPPIRLEDDCEPSWSDAKTRLKVAAETMGFPFSVTLDETPYAYKTCGDYMAERADDNGELSSGEVEAIVAWWNVYAIQVSDWPQALAALYPWFHDGEEMPK